MQFDRVMMMGLLAGIFLLPLSIDMAWGCFLLTIALWSGRIFWTGEVIIRRNQLDLFLAGFVVLAGISVWQSDHAAECWYNYFYLVGLYVLVYFLVSQMLFNHSRASKAIWVLLGSTAAVCLVGLFQYVVGVDVTEQRWIDSEQFPELKTRIFSTLGNPNVLASFLVMTTGLSLGLSTGFLSRISKLALLVLTGLSMVCILLTYSRGAWLALGVMGVLFAFYWRRPSWRELMIAGAGLVFLALFSYESLAPRFRSILGMFNPADSSVALRWALWESTLAMIHEHPWRGLGWGSYRFVYPEYDFFVQNPEVIIYHGHNSLLSIAAEIGIPGMLFFASAWVMALVKSWKNLRRSRKTGGVGMDLGLVLALIGTAAFSLTDHVLFNVQVCATFWLLLGVSGNLSDRTEQNQRRFWINKKYVGFAGIFNK